MKKLLLILPILIIFSACLIFSACSTQPAKVKNEFKAEVTSEYNGEIIKTEVVSGNHMLDIEMKAPENLKGYCFKYNNSSLTLTYNELQLKTEKSYFPNKGFASIFKNVLDALDRESTVYSGRYDNSAQYKGKCESGDFIITSDYYTGYISKIEIKKLNFTALFKIR